MIIIDKREIQNKIPQLLEQLKVPTTFSQLEVSDYFDNGIPIEHKEAHDFVQSLTSGRLNNQLYNMSTNFETSILLVEGNMNIALMESHISRSAYLSQLASAIVKRAPTGKQGLINLVCVDTDWDAALFMKYIHEHVQGGEPRLPRMEHFSSKSDEILVYILSSFPDVGEVRAKHLISKFGGFDKLMKAKVEDFTKVEDIGPKTAKSFYTTLHRKVKLPIEQKVRKRVTNH